MSMVVNRAIDKYGHLSSSQKYIVKKFIKIPMYFILFLFGFSFVGINLFSISMLSGALVFGISFGLQQLFSNLISGVIILFDRSLKVGDMAEINGVYGEVIALGLRHISIQAGDGKIHLIPNSKAFTDVIQKSSQSNMVRLEVPIKLSRKHSAETVVRCIEGVLKGIAEKKKLGRGIEGNKCFVASMSDVYVTYLATLWYSDKKEDKDCLRSDILFDLQAIIDKEGIKPLNNIVVTD